MRTLVTTFVSALLAGCGSGVTGSASGPSSAPAVAVSGPVVLMGDSLTYYWNTRSTTLTHIADYVDVGVPGQETVEMLARFDTDVLAHEPSVVVILGGTNDMYLETDPTVDHIAEMADRAAHAGARVIIGMVPKGGNWQMMHYQGATGDAAIARWNVSLTDLAQSHGYQVADYYDALLTVGLVSGQAYGSQNNADYGDDFLHPDPAGYDAMWNTLKPLLVTDAVELKP